MSNEVTQETRPRMAKLKEYGGKNWRKNYLTRKDQIVKLLHELEIKNYEFIRTASRMLINDDRCVVIVIAKRTDNGHLRKIVIDTKLGSPTWQQFIDVTYNIGADSDVKIIIFDDGFLEPDGKSDSPGNEFMIWNLAARNNRCGVHTYLVHAKGTIVDGKKMGVSYLLTEGSTDCKEKNGAQLPSKEEVERAGFWRGCYHFVVGFEPFEPEDDIIGGSGSCYCAGRNLVTTPSWTDMGFYMNVVGMPGSEEVKWLWEKRRSKIEKHYPGCPITACKRSGKPYKIAVRVSEQPFTDCIYSTLDEKDDYAEWVSYHERRFVDLIDELLEDFPGKEKLEHVHPSKQMEYL